MLGEEVMRELTEKHCLERYQDIPEIPGHIRNTMQDIPEIPGGGGKLRK